MPKKTANAPPRAASRSALLLVALAVIYLALQSRYLFVTPFISGPDEPEHLAYVVSIATRFEIPKMAPLRYAPGYTIATPQAQHPPLYYAAAAPLYLVLAPFGRHAVWIGLRLLSALLGLVVLWLCWLAAGTVWESRIAHAYGMVAALALLPTFLYSTSTINSEPLAAVFGAAAFCFMARLLVGPFNQRTVLLLGVMLGLGALTKMTTLGWWPAAALALFLAVRARGIAAAERNRAMLILALPALAIPAAWWIRGSYLYGTPMPRSFSAPLYQLGMPFTHEHSTAFLYLIKQTIIGSYVPFFLMKTMVPELPALFCFGALWAVLAVGLGRSLLRGDHSISPRVRALTTVAILALAVCYLGMLQQTFFVDYAVAFSPGRYVFTYLPAFVYLISVAMAGLCSSSRRAIAGYGALGAILIGLNVASLALIHAFFAANPPPQILVP